MKELLKKIYEKLVLIIDSIKSLLSVLVFSSFSVNKQFKKQFKKQNSDCYLLGNGPSLRQELDDNLDFYIDNNYTVGCVNFFCENSDFFIIQPQFYIIADEVFWDDSNNTRSLDIQSRFFNEFGKIDWNIILYVPHEGRFYFEKMLKNEFVKIIYYNRTPVNGTRVLKHFLYKKNLGMPAPHNVLNAAIFIFINMGFKTVNIYGADHSWVADLYVDENNDLWSYQNHFYDDEKVAFKLKKGSLYTGLQGIVKAFESYQLLREYSESIGTKIINRTKKSFLDIFEYK